MALSDAELFRLRTELGDNLLEVAASPYLGLRSVWTVIQANLDEPTITTTSTTTVSTAGATALTLASATGFAAKQRVQIDTDEQREVVTIRAVSGSTISVLCRKTHSGTYPVEVETGETIVRGLLQDLEIARQRILDAASSAGLKQVDEVQWFGASDGRTVLDELVRHQRTLRAELARACGVSQFYRGSTAASSMYEVY